MADMREVLLLLSIIGMLTLGMTAYAFLKMYLRLKKGADDAKGSNQVGFVVETFHDLVSKLKQKELELEKLKKHAEQRADSMEDYNENILESVPSGVIGMDETLHITKCNNLGASILGMQIHDLLGADARELLPGIISAEGAHGSDAIRGECRYINHDGKRLWLGYTLTPLRDSAATVIGRLLVITDLTELKALAEQAELRKRLSSLGEMAAGIAHELRNSMGVITGYTRLLERKVDEPAMENVRSISREVSVMDRIITDFLSFARPRDLTLVDVELSPLVRECIASYTAAHEGVSLRVEVPGGLFVRADDVQLRQALGNLIGNAYEAMHEGGGMLSIAAARQRQHIVITVADTGHGIDESIKERIFHPFFTTKEKGTGLGLAVVHRIISSHGGELDVLANEPRGTIFRVTLPAGRTVWDK